MKSSSTAKHKRSMTPLLAMVAIFAAPVIAAWFFYLNPQFLPAGRTNKGELIDPVVHLSTSIALWTPAGDLLERSLLDGKWTLVYLAGGECGDACLDRLVAIRQIRLALGESALSVERLLVMTDPAAGDTATEMGARLDGMQVALTDEAGGRQLLETLAQEKPQTALDRVYILDPMGNLMMRYSQDAPAKDTLEDMERLLAASKNWIKGAQYGHR